MLPTPSWPQKPERTDQASVSSVFAHQRLLNLCSTTATNPVCSECFHSILHCFQHPCRFSSSSRSKGEISNGRWSGWLQALYATALSIFQVGSGEWEKMGVVSCPKAPAIPGSGGAALMAQMAVLPERSEPDCGTVSQLPCTIPLSEKITFLQTCYCWSGRLST